MICPAFLPLGFPGREESCRRREGTRPTKGAERAEEASEH